MAGDIGLVKEVSPEAAGLLTAFGLLSLGPLLPLKLKFNPSRSAELVLPPALKATPNSLIKNIHSIYM